MHPFLLLLHQIRRCGTLFEFVDNKCRKSLIGQGSKCFFFVSYLLLLGALRPHSGLGRVKVQHMMSHKDL